MVSTTETIMLDEANSRHMIQVLRMQNGEQVNLTNGKGDLFTAEIFDDHKKRCAVKILSTVQQEPSPNKITIAVSLIKNSSRFEWFLEKATEIGVSEIIPLICDRTEKQHFRFERMRGVMISAMLQSQQCRLPVLHDPVKYGKLAGMEFEGEKFIAHCEEDGKEQLNHALTKKPGNKIILIGPEGDFTKEEISLALKNHFIPVALGNTRLRTETAAVVSAAIMCIG